MELKFSQDWLNQRPVNSDINVTSGTMMSLDELDSRSEVLTQEFINQAPAIEIRRRGWLDTFLKSKNDITTESIYDAFSNLISLHPPILANQIKFRKSKETEQASLWRGLTTKLWIVYVANIAIKEDIPKFDFENLGDEWISELVQISRFDDGPLRAINFLIDSGIHVVVNNPLPTMKLDAATFMLDDNRPLIALTLRFDRVDNFWFNILHELGHIIRHLKKDNNLSFLDDFEEDDARDESELEAEADAFARNSAIPRDIWRRSEARRLGTKHSIIELARDLNIHPAIPAGRLRFETNNYSLHPELLGYDQVRKWFIE